MSKYRNTGAHFLRDDGTWVGRDVVFEPTEKELAMFSYKLKPVQEEIVPETPQSSTEESSLVWPMVMAPALYLRLHPTGPHAALAKRLVKEGESSGEQND